MIQEVKKIGKILIDAITPASLASNDIHPLDVSGNYDWNAQAFNYDICAYGTCKNTSFRTAQNGDTSYDSVGD